MALEVRDMVLVHVTAFKGHHKMQGGVPKHQQVPRAMPKTQKTPVLCNALDTRAGVIWLGSVQLQQSR